MKFSVHQLNKYMTNMGSQQFNYEVLRAAYDSDPKIQNIIKDFDHDRIELKSSEVDDLDPKPTGGSSVSSMAKSATDLGDKL